MHRRAWKYQAEAIVMKMYQKRYAGEQLTDAMQIENGASGGINNTDLSTIMRSFKMVSSPLSQSTSRQCKSREWITKCSQKREDKHTSSTEADIFLGTTVAGSKTPSFRGELNMYRRCVAKRSLPWLLCLQGEFWAKRREGKEHQTCSQRDAS